MDRRQLMAASAALLASGGAVAQSDKTISLVFPFAAGGGGDALARLLAEKMRASLGRTVIVENKTGAAGRLGTAAVKNSAPDGATVLLTPIAPMAVYQHVYPKLEYDPVADFVPVSQIATFDFGVAVHPSLPVKNMVELTAWIKANPDKANYATPGAGTLPHFFGVLIGRAIGVQLNHIPYKGSAPAVTDLISGHVPIMFTTTSDLIQQHKGGQVRIIATSDKQRSSQLPDVPTLKESGVAIEGTGWYGIFVAAKTPPDIVASLNRALVAAVNAPDVREKMIAIGLTPTGTTPEAFEAIHRADSALWEPAVKASGFKPEQ